MIPQPPDSVRQTRAPGSRGLQTALRAAVRREEFWIAYQPVVTATDDGRRIVRGAEALLRWRHPKLGEQLPGLFIPTMERSDLIFSVGEWVLNRACRDAQRWRDAGQEFNISVNVSPIQLSDDHFTDKVSAVLTDCGLPASALSLEITENVLIGHNTDSITRLNELAELGIRLYIDDFGTGFSSIAYLRRLPFSGIKIDRTFISGIAAESRGQSLVRWMVDLARSFDLDVIAEGVETHADAEMVMAQGISKLQGFFYDRGLPAAVFDSQYMQNQAA